MAIRSHPFLVESPEYDYEHQNYLDFQNQSTISVSNLLDFTSFPVIPVVKEKKYVKCPLHERKMMEYFCITCRIPLCQTCGLAIHAGHPIEEIEDSVEKERSRIYRQSSYFKTQIENITNSEKSLLTKVETRKANIIRGINEEADSLVSLIRLKQIDAVTEIESKINNITNQISDHIRQLELQLEGTLKKVDFLLHSSSDNELLSETEKFSKEMLKMIETEDSSKKIERLSMEKVMIVDTNAELVLELKKRISGLFQLATREYKTKTILMTQVPIKALASVIGLGKGAGRGQLHNPIGLALQTPQDILTGHAQLYVADTSNHRISVFNLTNGQFTRKLGSGHGSGDTQLTYPEGLLLEKLEDDRQVMFIADSGNNRVAVYDPNTGQHIRMIGAGSGSGPGQLSNPVGLACHTLSFGKTAKKASLLYVADRNNHRVEVFDAMSGQFIRTIGHGKGSGIGQLSNPVALAIFPSMNKTLNPELFVSDHRNNRIQVYDCLSGKFHRTIGLGKGSAVGQFRGPSGLALYPCTTGNTQLYVADICNHRIQVFDAVTGEFMRTVGSGPGTATGQLNSPSFLILYPGMEDKLLIVSDLGNHRIQVFSNSVNNGFS